MSQIYRSGALPRSVADAVVRSVAERTGIHPRDIRSPFQNRDIVPARHEVFWTLRQITHPDGTPKYSYPAMGAVFGMDHSSVRHAVKAHAKREAQEA